MVQAAEPRHGGRLATHLSVLRDCPACRRLLLQPKMSPVLMVVADVLDHQAPEMPLIEHDHMIEQVSAAAADEPLGDTVLPRATEAGQLGLDAKSYAQCSRPLC